jgi:hypothetical protein
VPSAVQANGPGPFLICARTSVTAPEIRYAWALSTSATMPYPACLAEMIGMPVVTSERSSINRPARIESFGIMTLRGSPSSS